MKFTILSILAFTALISAQSQPGTNSPTQYQTQQPNTPYPPHDPSSSENSNEDDESNEENDSEEQENEPGLYSRFQKRQYGAASGTTPYGKGIYIIHSNNSLIIYRCIS